MNSTAASPGAVGLEPLEVLLDTPGLPTFDLPDALSAFAGSHLFLRYALPRERGLPLWEALHAAES